MENWKPLSIAPYEYSISDAGNVRANQKIDARGFPRKERVLILSTNEDGYKKTSLTINKKCKKFFVHRLVYQTFIGEIPDGMEINHINGIRDDNRACNLNAMTHSDNILHSKTNLGTDYATYGNGRMTKEQREKIFELKAFGKSGIEIAKEIGFSKNQIYNVLNHKCWNVG